jgi:hypothetical protein
MMNFYLNSFSSNLELNLSHQEYSYKEVSFSLKYYLINLLKKYGTQKFYEKI